MRTAQLDTYHAALEKAALAMAPAFTFKFDFSKAEDYTLLADHAVKAADAILTRIDTLQAEVSKQTFEKAEAERKAKEAKP